MKVRFGPREVDFPGDQLSDELRDSAALVGDGPALQTRLAADGYLLLRGFHPAIEVEAARAAILEHLARHGALADDTRPLSARCPPEPSPPNMKGQRAITHQAAVAEILEGGRVRSLFESVFADTVRTLDYKWLRATPPGEFTGVHADSVYMGRGSPALLTCWVPFGDVPPELGPIALCLGSDRDGAYEPIRESYGRSDADRDRYGGWLTLDPLEISERFGGRWSTTSFGAGDVLVFGMQMLHASLVNATDEYRLSCDARFQPARDPADARWVGEQAREAKSSAGPHVATSAMRRAWRV